MELEELKDALIRPICDNCISDSGACDVMYHQHLCMKLDLTITSQMFIITDKYA